MYKLFTQLLQKINLNDILETHFEMHGILAFPLMVYYKVGNFQNHSVVLVHRNIVQICVVCVCACKFNVKIILTIMKNIELYQVFLFPK